jgi:predicted glutamine amidotransferase
MCRAIAYLGPPLRLSAALLEPDNALVRQSYHPLELQLLNLAGFGMVAWLPESHEPDEPLVYRTTELPIYDPNLESLAKKTRASCAIAHVRGIPYRASSGYGRQNLHPFRYPGFHLALAHNGDLHGIAEMRPLLLDHIEPAILAQIAGTTDSEWVYALLVSQLSAPAERPTAEELLTALRRTLEILRDARAARGIDTSSSLNLFVADGHRLLGLRFTFDFGCYALDDPTRLNTDSGRFLSLWYTAGERFEEHDGTWRMTGRGHAADAVLIASEPLTVDRTGWVEVPEYAAVVVEREGSTNTVRTVGMDV